MPLAYEKVDFHPHDNEWKARESAERVTRLRAETARLQAENDRLRAKNRKLRAGYKALLDRAGNNK